MQLVDARIRFARVVFLNFKVLYEYCGVLRIVHAYRLFSYYVVPGLGTPFVATPRKWQLHTRIRSRLVVELHLLRYIFIFIRENEISCWSIYIKMEGNLYIHM